MNIESLGIFGLILTPFLIAFLMEALVIYFFKLKGFWVSLGLSLLVNAISIGVVFFGGSFLLGKLGYEFNGLNLQPQVVAFLCWFSIIVEGLLLILLMKTAERKRIFSASILMNIASYFFLWFFIVN